MCMNFLTVSKAKSGFSGVARRVIRTRKAVTVRTPQGYVQIVPYDMPEDVPPAPIGSLGRYTEEQYRIANSFGDSHAMHLPGHSRFGFPRLRSGGPAH